MFSNFTQDTPDRRNTNSQVHRITLTFLKLIEVDLIQENIDAWLKNHNQLDQKHVELCVLCEDYGWNDDYFLTLSHSLFWIAYPLPASTSLINFTIFIFPQESKCSFTNLVLEKWYRFWWNFLINWQITKANAVVRFQLVSKQ